MSYRWVRHSKGGPFRKWYGNQSDVLLFSDNGIELKRLKTASLTGIERYGQKCLSWGRITSDITSFRYYGQGFIPNMAGLALYPHTNVDGVFLLAFLNCSVVRLFLSITNPTLNVPPGAVQIIPISNQLTNASVAQLARGCISISKCDWDSRETSWDFKRSPLV